MRIGWRYLRLVIHLLAGVMTVATLFPFLKIKGRRFLVRRWSARLVKICGITLSAQHIQPMGKALIVSNHISWLDIFVINAIEPCRFVAKSDIESWPIVGWLCKHTGTFFIKRGKASDVRVVFRKLVDAIADGHRVAFFPEGTTAEQGKLLKFHGNLFQAAIEAGVPVLPYGIRYLGKDGKYISSVDFVGDTTFVASIGMIFRGGPITAELVQLPLVDTSDEDRRAIALRAHRTIVAGLGLHDAEQDKE